MLLKTMHDSGPVQILIILHVLCVVPGNKHNLKPCINSTSSREFPDLYTAFVSVNAWQLIACSTGIYAIMCVKIHILVSSYPMNIKGQRCIKFEVHFGIEIKS